MSEVPSNLIPTRITQLDYAPVASEDSLLYVVYEGASYKIRAGDLLEVAGVPTTRQVIAGTGMTGGGPLSSDVTLSIAVGGVGTTQLANSGVTAGVYGNTTNIPVFTVDATGRVIAATTVPATITGYVPESRQVIAGSGLTGGGSLNANVTLAANFSNTTPLTGSYSGVAGTSTTLSRSDHKHPAVDLAVNEQVTGTLGLQNGGTGNNISANSGAIVWSGSDGLYLGPVGVANQVLLSNGTSSYSWANQSALNVGQATNLNGGNANKIPYQLSTNNTGFVDAPTIANTLLKWNGAGFEWGTIAGTGTVTSVALSLPSEFTVSGSPITSAGTLTATWTNPVSVSHGGTGVNSVTGYLKGSGTSPVTGITSIPNSDLANSSITLGTTNVSLGSTSLTLGGLTSVAVTQDPSAALQLATKQYVDNRSAAGIDVHTAVVGDADNNLSATYTQGGTTPTITTIAGGVTLTTSVNHGLSVNDMIVFNSTSNGLTAGTAYFIYSTPALNTITLADGYNGTQITGLTNGTGLSLTSRANSGVGATLTSTTNGPLTIEGYTFGLNDRILVLGQTSAYQNGVYYVSQVGVTLLSPWILTRATDGNKYIPNSNAGLDQGSYFLVTGGSDAGEAYVLSTSGVLIIGTTNISFDQFSQVPVYTAGTGLTLTGTQFSISNTAVSASSYGSASSVATFTVNAQGQLTSASNTSIAIDTSAITSGTLGYARGGTGSSSIPTAGAVTYGTGTALSYTLVGTSGQVLTSAGTSSPTWTSQSSLSVGTATTATNVAGGAAGSLVYQTGAAATSTLALGTTNYVLTAGATAPQYVAQSTLSVGSATTATNVAGGAAGSLVYQTGAAATSTLALGTTNYVLTAGATAPQYVAQSTLSVGSATTATTATNVAGGAAGSLVYQTGSGATSTLALGTSNYVLTAGATAPQYTAQSSLAVGTATNIAGGAASQLPYQTGAGATSFIANGTAGQVLTSAGSSVPVWSGIDGGTF